MKTIWIEIGETVIESGFDSVGDAVRYLKKNHPDFNKEKTRWTERYSINCSLVTFGTGDKNPKVTIPGKPLNLSTVLKKP